MMILAIVVVLIQSILPSSQVTFSCCPSFPSTNHGAVQNRIAMSRSRIDKWAGEYLLVPYWYLFGASYFHIAVPRMGTLACAHGNFDPAVLDYLTLRHKNDSKIVVPPTCPVATRLLVALHLTAHGKKDLVDCVIKMDTHPWITVFDMTNEKEHARAVIRCQARLISRITDTLKKAVGRGGKGRVEMTGKNSDPADPTSA